MFVDGTVVVAQGGRFRVNCSGSTSAWISRLTSAVHWEVSESGMISLTPPAVGDAVLCWFPGEALCDGHIVGIVEV